MHNYYCEQCGAALDPGEHCDCERERGGKRMITVTIPGETSITGAPITIVQLINKARKFDTAETTDDYIETAARDVWRLYGAQIRVTGDTPAERADSFLHEMARCGLLKLEEE